MHTLSHEDCPAHGKLIGPHAQLLVSMVNMQQRAVRTLHAIDCSALDAHLGEAMLKVVVEAKVKHGASLLPASSTVVLTSTAPDPRYRAEYSRMLSSGWSS